MARTLKIEFRGLCLFAVSLDQRSFHVFLANPKGKSMEHIAVRRYQQGGNWPAEEVAPGSTFVFGVPNTSTTCQLPSVDMSNLCEMPDTPPLPASRDKQSKEDERGSHITLRGGKLSVSNDVGIWQEDGQATQYLFPHIVVWEGEVADTDQSGNMEFWNAMPDEVPVPGESSDIPDIQLSEPEAAMRAAMHFEAYFKILGAKPRNLKYKGKKQARSHKYIDTIIVSSCPSAAITLVVSAASETSPRPAANGKSVKREIEAAQGR